MNQREFSRKLFLGNVWVNPIPKGKRFAANALNIGQGGLDLFCHQFLEVGHAVELLLRADPTEEKKLHGRVTNIRVEMDGNIMGIAFACPLSPEEKQTLYKTLGVKT
jgi:hypothetical protein